MKSHLHLQRTANTYTAIALVGFILVILANFYAYYYMDKVTVGLSVSLIVPTFTAIMALRYHQKAQAQLQQHRTALIG